MAELSLYPSRLLNLAAGSVLVGALCALALAPVPLWAVLAGALLPVCQCCRLTFQFWQSLCQRTVATQKIRLGTSAFCVGNDCCWRRYNLPRLRFRGEWLLILELTPATDASSGNKHSVLSRWLHKRCLLVAIDSLSAGDNWRLRYYLHNVVERNTAQFRITG